MPVHPPSTQGTLSPAMLWVRHGGQDVLHPPSCHLQTSPDTSSPLCKSRLTAGHGSRAGWSDHQSGLKEHGRCLFCKEAGPPRMFYSRRPADTPRAPLSRARECLLRTGEGFSPGGGTAAAVLSSETTRVTRSQGEGCGQQSGGLTLQTRTTGPQVACSDQRK